MSVGWIVKLNFLVLGLGLVMWAIYALNYRGLSPSVKQALGIHERALSHEEVNAQSTPELTTTPSPPSSGETTSKIKKFTGALDLCGSEVQSLSKTPDGLLHLELKAGQHIQLNPLADGSYMWRGQVFYSQDIEQALSRQCQ